MGNAEDIRQLMEAIELPKELNESDQLIDISRIDFEELALTFSVEAAGSVSERGQTLKKMLVAAGGRTLEEDTDSAQDTFASIASQFDTFTKEFATDPDANPNIIAGINKTRDGLRHISNVLFKNKVTENSTNDIYSVFYIDEDEYDNNAIVRANSEKEAMEKIEELTFQEPLSAELLDDSYVPDESDIAEMDSNGYYVYDSGS